MNGIDLFNCCKFAGADFVTYSTIASILIAQSLNSNEINLLGNFLLCVGQNLATIAILKQNCEEKIESQNKEDTTK